MLHHSLGELSFQPTSDLLPFRMGPRAGGPDRRISATSLRRDARTGWRSWLIPVDKPGIAVARLRLREAAQGRGAWLHTSAGASGLRNVSYLMM
jgi:hypothetical protein